MCGGSCTTPTDIDTRVQTCRAASRGKCSLGVDHFTRGKRTHDLPDRGKDKPRRTLPRPPRAVPRSPRAVTRPTRPEPRPPRTVPRPRRVMPRGARSVGGLGLGGDASNLSVNFKIGKIPFYTNSIP